MPPAKRGSAASFAGVFARLLLGGLMFYAGFSKIMNIPAFGAVVENYKMLPIPMARIVAVVLPWNEVMIGAMLILGIWTRTAALLQLLLCIVFIGAVSQAIVRKLNISCGCFNNADAAKVGIQTLAIDVGVLVLALVVIFTSSGSAGKKVR